MGIMKIGGKLLSNLVRKPATEDYPAKPRDYPERSRGHLEYDPDDCILCNLCGRNCPAGAIRADKTARTLTIERMQCIQCGYCVEKCPKDCLRMVPGYTVPGATKTVDTFTVPQKEKQVPKRTTQTAALPSEKGKSDPGQHIV